MNRRVTAPTRMASRFLTQRHPTLAAVESLQARQWRRAAQRSAPVPLPMRRLTQRRSISLIGRRVSQPSSRRRLAIVRIPFPKKVAMPCEGKAGGSEVPLNQSLMPTDSARTDARTENTPPETEDSPMTEITDNTTNTTAAAELEALRAHNAELLADLRKAKEAAKDAQAALLDAETARDTAHERYLQAALRGPVERLTDYETKDGPFFRELFARSYKFALDDDGGIVIRDLEGKPATIAGKDGKPEREAAFTRDDIMALCAKTPHSDMFDHIIIGSRASGGGAMGGLRPAGHTTPTASKPASDAKPANEFGLR